MSINTILQKPKYQLLISNLAEEGRNALTKYATLKLLIHLQDGGYFSEKNKIYSLIKIKKDFNFSEKYERLFNEVIDILAKNNYLQIDNDIVKTTEKVTSVTNEFFTLNHELYHGKFKTPEYEKSLNIFPYIELMNSTCSYFLEVARGNLGYLNVLFPKGDKTIVESIYKTNIQELYNEMMATFSLQLCKRLNRDSPIKILEVGAGTGGTSITVLELLRKHNILIKYVYTDISPGMLRVGKSKFNSIYDFIEYKSLNIDNNPEEQGFETHNFDIILCSNVLHATLNINNTLANIKKLLVSSDGYLLINEVIEKLDFNTITFGLTDGWWKYTDEENRVTHSPIIKLSKWKELLQMAKFKEAISTSDIEHTYNSISQGILVYKS